VLAILSIDQKNHQSLDRTKKNPAKTAGF